jgi:hypothetical protein
VVSRDVTVNINADDNTARGVDSAARRFDGLDRKVAKSGTDRNRRLTQDAKKSVSIFQGIFGDLVKQGQQQGILAGGATITGFSSAFKALPPEVKIGIAAGLAGAAVAAMPAIVAVAEAGILVGIGGGALAAGLALAAKDPKVAAAFVDLGNHVTTRLTQAVKPFVPEMIAAAGIAGSAFDRLAPKIDRIGVRLASVVQPLAKGLAGAVENAFPGIEKAINASLPLIREFAAQLPRIGQLLGDLFAAAAKGGPGAALAFKFILVNVEALILGLTWLTTSLGGVANGVAVLVSKSQLLAAILSGHDLEMYGTKLAAAGSAATTASGPIGTMAQAVYNTADAARQANSAFSTLFGELMNVDQANLAVKTGMANLTATIKDNKKTLDQNTESGRQNVSAILSQVQSLDQKRQADIAAGNGTKTATDKANAAYASQVQSLRNVLVSMGLTAAEVDNLIGKYASIPREINTTITTTYRQNGTPSRGHSQDPTGLNSAGGDDGWAPARHAARGFAGSSGSGNGRTVKPYRVESSVNVAVLLDGQPVREIATKVAAAETKRTAWRDRVGLR